MPATAFAAQNYQSAPQNAPFTDAQMVLQPEAMDAISRQFQPYNSRGYRVAKRTLDVILPVLMLIILSPFLLLIGLLVKRGGGNALYSHTRIGKHGRSFQCYKFRTMIPNADKILNAYLSGNLEAREEWARDRKLKNDPRITRVGSFLRRTSLDELPQLLNVIKGEMSLVGPRPMVYEELQLYGENLKYYLSVRPGLTGLWQVSGRNDVSYDQRIALDVDYVTRRSLWRDLGILWKTVGVVVWRKGAY